MRPTERLPWPTRISSEASSSAVPDPRTGSGGDNAPTRRRRSISSAGNPASRSSPSARPCIHGTSSATAAPHAKAIRERSSLGISIGRQCFGQRDLMQQHLGCRNLRLASRRTGPGAAAAPDCTLPVPPTPNQKGGAPRTPTDAPETGRDRRPRPHRAHRSIPGVPGYANRSVGTRPPPARPARRQIRPAVSSGVG